MNFRLIIDPSREEEVVVTARARTPLIDQLERLVAQSAMPDRIAAYAQDEVKMLSFEHIECITVLDGKTWAIDIRNQRYQLRQRLYELEEKLPGYFIRINKSTLANENHLEKFTSGFSGAVDAVFKCGYTDYVSRRCFAQIKRRYGL